MKMNIANISRNVWGVMAIAGLGLTTACSSDLDETAATTDDTAIQFSASVEGMKTRMVENRWQDGDQVGVCIADQTVPYYIKDVATGEMASNDPNKYEYKENTSFTINAFYPYPAVEYDLTDQSSEETRNNLDKLLGATATSTEKVVNLQFTHALTKVQFMLQTANGYTEDEIKAAKVTFIGYGKVNVTGGVWKGVGEPTAEITPVKDDDINGWAYMAPAEMWDKPMFKVEIAGDKFVYIPSKSNEADVRLEKGVLKAGYIQKYFIHVDKNNQKVFVKVQSSNITPWNGDGSDKGAIDLEAPQD